MVSPTLTMGRRWRGQRGVASDAEPVRRAGVVAAGHVGRGPEDAHPPVHQPRQHQPADDGDVAERRAGRSPSRRGSASRRSSSPTRAIISAAAWSWASRRRAAASRSGRARSGSRPPATRALVEEFSRIAAEEYVAVGIRGAYHPQVDLATEPRWARISGTFGEDADLTSDMVRAMMRGFQGKALGPKSVALIVKHFPGGGPAIRGQDSHFEYGKYDVYPGKNFEYHVKPFKAAIDAGAVAIMPYYSIPKDITPEQVGMSLQQGDRHRPAPRPPRLQGRGQLGLGHHDVDGVGRRVTHRRAALQEGHRRGRRHLQQRHDAGTCRQSRTQGRAEPRRASTSRRVASSASASRSASSRTRTPIPTWPSGRCATRRSRRRRSTRSASRWCCCKEERACCR